MSSKKEKGCKFCELAAKREDTQYPCKVVSVTIGNVTRKVILWTDHVHASCNPELVAIGEAELANRPS